MTNPAKNALIQDMMSVCGIIIAILPFIAAGSDIGFGAAWPRDSGPPRRKEPFLNESIKYSLRDVKAGVVSAALALLRRLMARKSDWRSRDSRSEVGGLGGVWSRTVA